GVRTRFLTRCLTGPTVAEKDLPETLRRYHPLVFEPLHALTLYQAHNTLAFYTWGDDECCLPRGATRATLRDDAAQRLRLRAGDVPICAEQRRPATGQPADADPAHRHAVRLTRVVPEADLGESGGQPIRTPAPLQTDILTGQPIVEIEWDAADALPFPCCLSA